MNSIAIGLNKQIEAENPNLIQAMSAVGRQLYFPKGILPQSAEAKEKAHHLNATIGIAKENGHIMHFKSVMDHIQTIRPRDALAYAPSFGIPELRKAWQKEIFNKNPSLSAKSISLPVVTCGITHGVSLLADLWVDPGDVIILPQMMWGNYNLIFHVRKGAKLSHYDMFTLQGTFNVDGFAKCIADEAQRCEKLIVMLNFPHNPSGYTPTHQEGQQIVDVLLDTAQKGSQVIAATDDAYFGLFYEPNALQESLFAHLAQLHPRLVAVKLDGATKENYVWGLRLGFITYGCHTDGDPIPVYEALEKKTAGCIRSNISNASHLSQSILLKSLEDHRYPIEKEEKFVLMEKRARAVKKVLENSRFSGVWEPYPFNSGYFMCLHLKTVHAETLRQHLLNQYGVGLIALDDQNIRIAFSCLEEKEIPELFDLIYTAIKELE
jgi:aspartate/methionine/tyrosine aminotransferase